MAGVGVGVRVGVRHLGALVRDGPTRKEGAERKVGAFSGVSARVKIRVRVGLGLVLG